MFVESWPENPYTPPQADLDAPQMPDPPEGEQLPIPYEDSLRHPDFWLRCKETVVQGIKENQAFLQRVPVGEGFVKPWQFLMISIIPMTAFALLILVPLIFLGVLSGPMGRKEQLLGSGVVIGIAIGVVVLVPLFMFLGMLLMGAIDHFGLWIWGGTKAGIELNQTIRASAYAQGIFSLVMFPLQVLGMIPLIGILFSMVSMAAWCVFYVYKGLALARMHQTDPWRGVCAVFTPLILLCCCGMIAAISIPAIMAAR